MAPELQARLARYAELIIKSGCNLQQGQELYLAVDVACIDFARLLVATAYRLGAGNVICHITDEAITRMDYTFRPVDSFKAYPAWMAELRNGAARNGDALLFVSSEDPEAFAGLDQRKFVENMRAANAACRDWRDGMDFRRNVWCIAGAASPRWASRVFPDLPTDEAVAKLWDAILTTVHMDGPDPVTAWEEHRASFVSRVRALNKLQLDSLHYTNALGTDITVGLTPRSVWQGGGDTTTGGIDFFPNMPTEEIFTSPDRNRADGIVYASLPLGHAGSLIEDFSITFEHGRIVDCIARKGLDILRQAIGTDEGSHYLGEVALVPRTSPIKRAGILFLNTLFDENAACHMAFGTGFPDCYEGGTEMSKGELLAAGINDSAIHVDFMLGTDDLAIDGTTRDGRQVAIFRDGDWAF